jgi:hypothetical protein
MRSLVTLVGLVAPLLGGQFMALQAFTIQRTTTMKTSIATGTLGPLFAANSENTDEDAELFPGMSREELRELLDGVPVYAVTEPDKEGLVLLKEKDKENDIAYFFFSAETANTVFAPLRQKNEESAKWDVTQYPLGLVWFELFKNPEPGIEYRLVPDANNLGGARTLMEQQSKQLGVPLSDKFQKGYNEIPIFMDQRLRIQAADGEERFPMYMALQDLISTLQQASGEYEAALNVADLETLLEQMQAKSENDFRKSVVVPPSPPPPQEQEQTSAPSADSTYDVLGRKITPDKIKQDDEPISTPTAMDNWDD